MATSTPPPHPSDPSAASTPPHDEPAYISALRSMLAALGALNPWTPGCDAAIPIRGHIERARPAGDAGPDTVPLALLDADGAPLTEPFPFPRSRILGAWTPAYRSLAHGAPACLPAGKASPRGLDVPRCPACGATTEPIDIDNELVWQCMDTGCRRRTYGTVNPDDDGNLPAHTEGGIRHHGNGETPRIAMDARWGLGTSALP